MNKKKELAKIEIEKLKQGDNKERCWLCQQWQTGKYMKSIPFNDKEERVCVSCTNKLIQRDQELEMEMEQYETFKGAEEDLGNGRER